MNGPLVSIVVPSFNGARFLADALRSLADQTYENLEVIVQDNESNDGTREVIDRFRSTVDEIAIERDEGQSDALVRGFRKSRGEILGWLNVDDVLMPGAIEDAVVAFSGGSQPDVVLGHCALMTAEGQFLRYFNAIQGVSAGTLGADRNPVPQPSTFFLRRAYDAVGGLDASLQYTMDWDLWCRFGAAGCRFHLVDEVLSAMRMHASTKTSRGGLARLREIWAINRRYGGSRLPRATLSHLWDDYILQRREPRRRLPWARFARRPGDRMSAIRGLGPGGRIVVPSFEIRFPAVCELSGARLRVSGRLSAGDRLTASLNGCSGESAGGGREVHWDFPRPTRLPDIRVCAELTPGSDLGHRWAHFEFVP